MYAEPKSSPHNAARAEGNLGDGIILEGGILNLSSNHNDFPDIDETIETSLNYGDNEKTESSLILDRDDCQKPPSLRHFASLDDL